MSYNPVEFLGKIQLLTIAIIGSFITMKFLNALYESIYEPVIDVFVDSRKTDEYYIRIGTSYIQIGMVIKELIKWFILIIILMIIYNIYQYKN